MRISLLLGAAFLTVLAGCNRSSGPPTPPGKPDDFVRAADVLVAAQCELNAAAARDGATVRFRKAEVTMTLTVQRTEATGGGITLAIPIASTEVQLSRNRTPRGAALRKMDFRITHALGEPGECPTKDHPLTASGVRYIDGGLGLGEWLAETDTLVAKSGQVPAAVNYELVFEVAVSSDLSPVFSRPINDADGSLSTRDSDAREVKHRIAVTIVPEVKGRAVSDKARQDAAREFLDRIAE